MNDKLDVFALFPTPIVHFEVPDSAALNAELRAAIEKRQKSDTSGTLHSNYGGWQSVDVSGNRQNMLQPYCSAILKAME